MKKKQYALPLKSLLGMALQSPDSEASWAAIREMQGRADQALVLVRKLFVSRNWHKRALAINVVCQLYTIDPVTRKYESYAAEQTHEILFAALGDEKHEVIVAAIFGFGHRKSAAAIPHLIRYAQHPCAKIRHAVAFALGGCEVAEAIDALLQLAGDQDDDVRDWATFSLGSMCTSDTSAIRDCLWRNMSDEDEDVRGEALVGLAERRDTRIIPPLLAALTKGDCRVYELEAAEMMADPVLYPSLKVLHDTCDIDDGGNRHWGRHLEAAMAACAPESGASYGVRNE